MRSYLLRLRHLRRPLQQAVLPGAEPVYLSLKAQSTEQPDAMRYGTTERAFFDGSVMIW